MTDYRFCFRTFTPGYDPMVMEKKEDLPRITQETYENTKEFAKALSSKGGNYSGLDDIANKINLLNDCFRDLVIAIYRVNIDKTREVNPNDKEELERLRLAAENTYNLAQLAVKNLHQFPDTIVRTLRKVEEEIQLQQSQPNLAIPLDAVDNQLILGSRIQAPLLNMQFGTGMAYNPNAHRGGHTKRSQASLMNEEGFRADSNRDLVLPNLLKTLRTFAARVEGNNYKVGMTYISPEQLHAKLHMTKEDYNMFVQSKMTEQTHI